MPVLLFVLSDNWSTRQYKLVMFWPGLAQKLWLWLGLRWLWPAKILGRAKGTTHSLALACHGFWHIKLISMLGHRKGGIGMHWSIKTKILCL
ncbi:hypothetical protein BYT27DRAFT_7309420 [Phlegmacium glaucopus]|nr:hypothetical protein BYT27DRAFT_7309420 [Phlegmacium glaucopus]